MKQKDMYITECENKLKIGKGEATAEISQTVSSRSSLSVNRLEAK